MNIRTALAGAILAAGAALSLATPATAAPAQIASAAAYDPCSFNRGADIFYGVTDQRVYGANQFCMINGSRRLVFQADGNLVLYSYGRATWQSGTAGQGTTLIAQGDGNLVIYRNPGGTPVWQSGTSSPAVQSRRLAVQTDGNVVIYEVRRGGAQPVKGAPDSSAQAAGGTTYRALWQTGTSGR